MSRSLVRLTLAGLALVLAACYHRDPTQPSALHLDITADRASYTAGSTATIAIRNLGGTDVGYNPCPSILQREVLGTWLVTGPSNVLCPAAIYVLTPGATATEEVGLPADLAPGRYRVYFPILHEREAYTASAELQASRSSKPFTVTAP